MVAQTTSPSASTPARSKPATPAVTFLIFLYLVVTDKCSATTLQHHHDDTNHITGRFQNSNPFLGDQWPEAFLGDQWPEAPLGDQWPEASAGDQWPGAPGTHPGFPVGTAPFRHRARRRSGPSEIAKIRTAITLSLIHI